MNIPRPEFQTTALSDLCRRYQVRELALFGSTARGEQSLSSDIDLFLAVAGLSRELSVLMRRPVDLVPKASLKKTLREQVLAEAEVDYALDATE